MSEVKVNKISPRTNCGTVQLGDSGDTITIPAGATITNNGTQTGFGRTGTVDWDTTAKTAAFTAVSGNGYFVNTTSGAITVTLPAGSAGDIVGISDYASTFQTNNVTITPNGTDKINGINQNATLSTQGIAVSLVYVDATRGWKSVTGSDNDTTGIPPYIEATGGTITCCGDYKIHTFTGPGTFTVTRTAVCAADNEVDYLVVAGGGGSGGNGGGGGGGGGFRLSNATCMPAPLTSPLANPTGITVTATSFPITVGGGGAGTGGCSVGNSGSNSVFSTITSTGGGGGGGASVPVRNGLPGGSGGGAHRANTAGSGNTPPTSPPQGNNGNAGDNSGGSNGGGGGGAGAAGSNGGNGFGGAGGSGSYSNINTTTGVADGPVCSARYYAGGGGAGGASGCNPEGGAGGGADGLASTCGGAKAPSGTANTGGGGGGGAQSCSGGGGDGGSGIVIIRYKYQ